MNFSPGYQRGYLLQLLPTVTLFIYLSDHLSIDLRVIAPHPYRIGQGQSPEDVGFLIKQIEILSPLKLR